MRGNADAALLIFNDLTDPVVVVGLIAKDDSTVAAWGDILVPIILRACVPPALYGAVQSADLPDWDGASTDKQFLALLPPLGRLTGRQARAKQGLQRAGGREGDLVVVLRSLLVR